MIHATAQALAAPHAAVMLAAEQLVIAAGFNGGHGVRRPGAGDDFWAYAPYRTGDDSRRIDWRRSARHDSLIVRQHERQAPRTLSVWCDPGDGMNWSSHTDKPTKKTVAYCLGVATALVFAKGGERIRVGTARWSGLAVRDQILTHMMTETGEPHAEPGADILMISDGLDARWPARWQALARTGARGVLALVSDPAERDFPYTGAIAFQGMSGRKRHLLHNAAAVQHAYRSAYRAHIDHVVDDAQAAGFAIIPIDTHAALEPGLAAIVHALSGRSI